MTSQLASLVQAPWAAAAAGLTAVLFTAGLASVPRVPVAPVPGTAPTVVSATIPVAVLAAAPPSGTVLVTMGTGVLAITTPYTAASPLQLAAAAAAGSADTVLIGSLTNIAQAVKIVDTRPAKLGFVAQVLADDPAVGGGTASGARAGVVGVQALQVQGNALRSDDVHASDAPPEQPGLASPQTIARYAGGLGIGTAWLAGTLELNVAPNRDEGTMTVTFTAF